MSLAVCVNANAGFWYTNHHKADELRGTKEFYSNVYNDGGDYFKCYNDGSGNDYVMIGADMGIFDYENYEYIYSDYKYMYATIGFYKNGHLIERASFRFNLYSGDFDFAYSSDGDELSTKIINHLKNVGDVRIIAPKYSGPDFDITIPMNPNLITNVNEVKNEVKKTVNHKSSSKIETTDLIGDIENFPIEVVQKMVDEQVRQGNRADVTIFQRDRFLNKENKGFTWWNTKDGQLFWNEVIRNCNFDLFFEKYPIEE